MGCASCCQNAKRPLKHFDGFFVQKGPASTRVNSFIFEKKWPSTRVNTFFWKKSGRRHASTPSFGKKVAVDTRQHLLFEKKVAGDTRRSLILEHQKAGSQPTGTTTKIPPPSPCTSRGSRETVGESYRRVIPLQREGRRNKRQSAFDTWRMMPWRVVEMKSVISTISGSLAICS